MCSYINVSWKEADAHSEGSFGILPDTSWSEPLEEPLGDIWHRCMSVPNMCAWPLDLLCSPGCPACRCLATAKPGDHSCCMEFEGDFRTASPQTRGTQLLLVCFASSCPKRRHPLCSVIHWLTHRSAILRRILPFPCTVWSWAGLQAVQENAGGLKNAFCVWLNRNMKMLLKKERTQLGNRWKTGKGKQAITGKIAKCCRGLGQIPVVRVDLSQSSADARGSKACFQMYTPETPCPWAGTAASYSPGGSAGLLEHRKMRSEVLAAVGICSNLRQVTSLLDVNSLLAHMGKTCLPKVLSPSCMDTAKCERHHW